MVLITETNVPHEENISYFGETLPESGLTDEAQLVYQFPLAPLILHTLASAYAGHLSDWAASIAGQGLFFNFIASHDGIGLLPARGLLSETALGRVRSTARSWILSDEGTNWRMPVNAVRAFFQPTKAY